MQAFFTDRYVLPLPAGHRFPMQKYARLRERVATELPGVELCVPPAASEAQLLMVHASDYVRRVCSGGLSATEQRRIGFPWSAPMVERSLRSVGATVAASRTAMSDGVAVNLAGGTHHAHRGHGQGYCVFNDIAVAARCLQRQGAGPRQIAVIDLDVHQGDGTASIFAADESVFTLSLHGASNFPFRKATSDLDVALPDGCGDADYLDALEQALAALCERCRPEFLFYLAGADPLQNDRLGRLSLTLAGLAERDAKVFELARRLHVPIVVTMAGGYGKDVEMTVAAHLSSVRAALAHWRGLWAGRE